MTALWPVVRSYMPDGAPRVWSIPARGTVEAAELAISAAMAEARAAGGCDIALEFHTGGDRGRCVMRWHCK